MVRSPHDWARHPISGWLVWPIVAAVAIAMRWGDVAAASATGALPVVWTYRVASLQWLEAASIYTGDGRGFVYLPHAAIFYVPFGLLTPTLGAASWRLVNVALFAVGTWRLSALGARGKDRGALFLVMSAIAAALGWSALRHGQMTLAMGSMMMLAAVDLAERRWWRATLWLCLGLGVKPLIVVFLLLVWALYRPLWGRLLLGLLALALVPFLTQAPAYVLDQYAAFVDTLHATTVRVPGFLYPQLTDALATWGFGLPGWAASGLRLVAALATLGAGWWLRRVASPPRAAMLILTLAVGYILLFGTRTESNTYALIGPVIGFFLGHAWIVARRPGWVVAYLALLIPFLVGYEIAALIGGHAGTWLKPMATVALLLSILLYVRSCGWFLAQEDPGLPDGA